ncbi:BrnT family toxin [Candidatus Saccharibacteria bacterium]|nr:BrnT family toxin [Candidatus Saccharibacteria bacterium]
MKILPEPITYIWDKGNIDKNLLKHNVTIHEAEEMFFTQPFVVRNDLMHAEPNGARYQALGKTKASRKLFVAFTIRNKQIRVISIREMTINEERVYEKLEANS